MLANTRVWRAVRSVVGHALTKSAASPLPSAWPVYPLTQYKTSAKSRLRSCLVFNRDVEHKAATDR